MFWVFESKAAVYTSIANGSYNDCAIWDIGCPNNSIQSGDTVIVNHIIAASSSMYVKGVLIVNNTGSFSTSNDMEIDLLGTFTNNGIFICNAEYEVNGYFYQSGTATIQFLHNDGYICNSGTINVADRVYNHGGIIECDGNIFTCELDMRNNNGAAEVTGSAGSFLAGQDVCCTAGVSSNPFDELEDDWSIDSVSVAICVLPLIPNAGDNDSVTVCNSIGSQINLNNLLSSDNTGGSFTETTSSGAFDNLTGILNTQGLLAGDYIFTFTAPGYNGTSDVSEFTVTVTPVLESEETMAVCESAFPFDWNGIEISEPSSNTVTLTSTISGCDSLATLIVSANSEYNESVDITICASSLPYEWNGLSIEEEGSQTVTFASSLGCDSIITLNLFVNAIPTSMNDTLVCGSQLPFIWNGTTINGAGSETVSLTGVNGCDSLATINVALELLEAPVIDFSGPVACPKDLVSFEISDENTNAIYQWLGPNGYVSTDVSNQFELTTDLLGTYSVSYTLDNCSSEMTYIDLEIENVFDYQQFKFPNVITADGNGINDEINLEDYVGPCAEFVLTIRDRWGSEVYRQERGGDSFKGLSVDGRELPEGVYFYRFIFDQDADVSGFLHIVR